MTDLYYFALFLFKVTITTGFLFFLLVAVSICQSRWWRDLGRGEVIEMPKRGRKAA